MQSVQMDGSMPWILGAAGAPPALPAWSVIPFAVLLLCIAILPLAAGHFWHENRNKLFVVALFTLPTVGYLAWEELLNGQPTLAPLAHEIEQYVVFIILLGSLYAVAGGLVIAGDWIPSPRNNTLLLALGAVLANLIGTTGASVVLIRPFLRVNRRRVRTTHLPIFFIFIVSNLGGLLTPLGDPPLFLGFLNQVPFAWTLSLWPHWLLSNGVILCVFWIWDVLAWRKDPLAETSEPTPKKPITIKGLVNVLLLAGVIGAVLLQAVLPGVVGRIVGPGLMLIFGLISLAATPHTFRDTNAFTWEPMTEVAILFAGIFITMVPALAVLQAHSQDFGITKPWEYFWLTGLLSSHLDNAPTYLTFATLAAESPDFSRLVADGVPGINGPQVLQAISCGAVLMGAVTYIGNGPNFMVKAIADKEGFATPSFFGYLAYSYCVLMPLFIVFTFVFFV